MNSLVGQRSSNENKKDSLLGLKRGEKGVIKKLCGDEDFRGRMFSMGLLPGTKISLISGGRGQPLVLKTGDTRLMLDRKIAEKIEIY